MTTLIGGASGATGRLLVEQLLQYEQDIKTIVRTTNVKFVLMNTSGNNNRDLPEKIPFGKK